MLDMEQGQVQEGVVRTGELAGKKNIGLPNFITVCM